MEYQSKKHRKEKLKADRFFEDAPNAVRSVDDDDVLKKGDRARLSELTKWARWSCYLLAAIAAMVFLFFLRDALTVILSLFGT